jgi:hypothetical protein
LKFLDKLDKLVKLAKKDKEVVVSLLMEVMAPKAVLVELVLLAVQIILQDKEE